jgi:hypothetical protein
MQAAGSTKTAVKASEQRHALRLLAVPCNISNPKMQSDTAWHPAMGAVCREHQRILAKLAGSQHHHHRLSKQGKLLLTSTLTQPCITQVAPTGLVLTCAQLCGSWGSAIICAATKQEPKTEMAEQ